MNKEEQRLKEKLLAKYSEAVDEMLRRCRDKEEFSELEDEVERLAQATLPATLSELAEGKDFPP
jgi:DNA-binding HxlR family transcriptional regulator